MKISIVHKGYSTLVIVNIIGASNFPIIKKDKRNK